MANGLTSATKEDGQIQAIRWNRAGALDAAAGVYPNRRWRQQYVGWSIGRGYEADLHDAIRMSDAMRYNLWLRRMEGFGRGKAAVLVTGAGRNERPMMGSNAGSTPVPTLQSFG